MGLLRFSTAAMVIFRAFMGSSVGAGEISWSSERASNRFISPLAGQRLAGKARTLRRVTACSAFFDNEVSFAARPPHCPEFICANSTHSNPIALPGCGELAFVLELHFLSAGVSALISIFEQCAFVSAISQDGTSSPSPSCSTSHVWIPIFNFDWFHLKSGLVAHTRSDEAW